MRRIICGALVILLGGASCASPQPDQPVSDFDQLVSRLTGSWDNVEQAASDIAAGADEANRHPRRAMTYVAIDNDNIDGQLFAIQNYGELGFDGPLSRISLHRFRPDGDTIVHEFMFLLDKQRWGDLSLGLSPLTEITEADVRINENCAMVWHRVGDHFEGSTTEGRCVTSSFTPEPIRVEGHGELHERLLIRHDQNYSLQGKPLPVAGGASPERFKKVSR